jgi:hypothetical protein
MISEAAPVLKPLKIRSAGRDFARPALALPIGAPGRFTMLLTKLSWLVRLVWTFASAGVSLTSFFLELAARGRPDGG